MYSTLSDEYGLHAVRADCVIEARGATADIAENLGLAPGDSVLGMVQTTFDENRPGTLAGRRRGLTARCPIDGMRILPEVTGAEADATSAATLTPPGAGIARATGIIRQFVRPIADLLVDLLVDRGWPSPGRRDLAGRRTARSGPPRLCVRAGTLADVGY
ncbi:UTRA domain-containing protein [Streptomyces sp. NPDC008139]|uniref:UTRA domain-containing protein n=1 Tax=Streptomyces sp. NPDC008139 TaxID=3364814 RepID=UPI0036E0279D